ncbi:hypothetical protein PAECIP111893_00262 [Paenibacillus plantiphilus]|uniref:Dit-like phage tail protein N-terminal domain-containing protein n=1 Tax=Paenibacillus plantiphilus TaxID=2905650 RepID=A0ABM9BM85_9BACL|nr:hypothetical protein [Paenibacillus plantiphilus]CAH1190296.1 hypothetical protein PAECIP111893_00262 [Paenibacillus plantiphilus]
MATIDGHYVLVEGEEQTFENDVTQQPVEKGIDITDHVQRKARTLPISGFVAGNNAAKTRAYLIKAADQGKVVKYVGRNAFSGVISGLTTGHDSSIANGFSFSLTLIEVRIATSSAVGKLPTPIKSQAAPVISSGTKQTKDTDKGGKGGKGGKKTGGKSKKKKEKVQKVTFKSGDSKWKNYKVGGFY